MVSGFTQTAGETFDFLTYGSLSGQFNTVLPFDPGYTYTVSYATPGMAQLMVAGVPVAAVPER